MATIASFQARYIGNASGRPPYMVGSPGITAYQEAATQTYAAGAVVRPDDTTGQIEIAPNADNVASLFGMAMRAATGVQGSYTLIRVFQPGDRYVMNYEASGSAGVTAQALIGDEVEFNIDSGNLKCDKNGAGGKDRPAGIIIDLFTAARGWDVGPAGDVLGDTNGRVVVELQPGEYWMLSA